MTGPEILREYCTRLNICNPSAEWSRLIAITGSKDLAVELMEETLANLQSNLPSEAELSALSYASTLNRSLSKIRTITEEVLNIVCFDATEYVNYLRNYRTNYCWRVKTVSSIENKVKRHADQNARVVFNDLLGLRFRVQSFSESYPTYFKVHDLRNGKVVDDGYRAVHLYYQKTNKHYPIEIQLWSNTDYDFNNWSHLLAYKHVHSSTLLKLREEYDAGLIASIADFERRLKCLQS